MESSECARKEYNHYEGMRYPPGDIQLASQYWTKSKYKNDWFTINSVTMKVGCYIRNNAHFLVLMIGFFSFFELLILFAFFFLNSIFLK